MVTKHKTARATYVDVHVGQQMNARRKQIGMSFETLGAIVGLTYQQMSKFGAGYNRISASRLWDIAMALDVDVNYFFEGLTRPEKAKGGPREQPALAE